MQQKFITKCVKFFITKCHSFIKNVTIYCKMQPSLQNALVQIFFTLENNLKRTNDLLNDRGVFKTLISDGAFFQKYQNYYSYFCKKAPS